MSHAAVGRGLDPRMRQTFRQTVTRGTDPISNTYNASASAAGEPSHLSDTHTLSRRSSNVQRGTGANNDRHGSASQTLSDLAAAASNRLMAENAAEVAAAQAAGSHDSGDSNSSTLPHTDRPRLLGALRSSRDPFFGTTFSPPMSTRGNVLNNANSAETGSQWATSEEMEVIRQSQAHELGTLANIQLPNLSPPPLPSDIQGISGRDLEGLQLRDFNSSFSHSPESSFVEVGGSVPGKVVVVIKHVAIFIVWNNMVNPIY